MATCKDCIHSGICSIQLSEHSVLDCNETSIRRSKDVEHRCLEFRDGSRFLELPCKVGDAVFSNVLGKMLEDKITSINIYENGARVLLGRGLWFDIEYIGSVIFLTREEAELALKERENNG